MTLEPEELRQAGRIYGVIFLFKYPTGEARTDTPKDGTFDYDAAENIFFAAQTIQNACGTQALLSVLLNKDGEVDIGKDLREFKEFTAAFPSDVRGFCACRRPCRILAKRRANTSLNSVTRRCALKL